MEIVQTCRVCGLVGSSEQVEGLRGTIRSLANNRYSVWRCACCQSLNALDEVDFNEIYLSYPLQKQKYDFLTKKMFSKRLKNLSGVGLTKDHSILDYGCGGGLFVRYLQELGYRCVGYEPYNSNFSQASVLQKKYDFVLCQDVIEHVDRPADFLADLRGLAADGGRLVIGTPYSDNIDIFDTIDQVGVLHQPFHRFIISHKEVHRFFSHPDWMVEEVFERWYLDSWFPFVNSQFLFHFFKSGGGVIDIGFESVSPFHWIKNPSLIFWGFFGRFFVKSQNLVIVARRIV